MKDLTGKKFTRLSVLYLVEGHKNLWHCRCECGKEVNVCGSQLENGHDKSCGCLNNENRKKIFQYTIKHGKTNTRLYSIWSDMKNRCTSPCNEHYSRYGGRGIKICSEWQHDFQSFYDWAMSHGYEENLSIDRINVNGNYCPDNCRWIEQKYQARNLEKTVYIITDDGKIPVVEFCERHNIKDRTYVYRKLKKGQTAEEILFDYKMLKNTPDEYMSLEEAAKYYNVCTVSIHHWYRDGIIKGLVSGRRLYILKGQEVPKYPNRDNKGRYLPSHNK